VIIGVKSFCIVTVSHVPSKSESPRAIKIKVRVRVRVILFHITTCERGRPKNILGTKKIIRGPGRLHSSKSNSIPGRGSDHRVIIGVKSFCIMSHVPSKSESESESESDRFTSQRASAGAFGRPRECAFFIISVTLQTSASQSESQSDD